MAFWPPRGRARPPQELRFTLSIAFDADQHNGGPGLSLISVAVLAYWLTMADRHGHWTTFSEGFEPEAWGNPYIFQTQCRMRQ
jgi:hypothetical protein